jgi:hypothetical protein
MQGLYWARLCRNVSLLMGCCRVRLSIENKCQTQKPAEQVHYFVDADLSFIPWATRFQRPHRRQD